ncbi:MAG: response regulator [Desulfobulbaceae bacterium]|nr:response regulator [Desulfobulbaceae bacterium]
MANKKILWIDDTPSHVAEAAEILRDEGYEVELLDSATAGAARIGAAAGDYLAVILDLLLSGETITVPGPDGPELLQTLHGQHGGITLGRWLKRRWPALNVIGVSIKSDPKDPQVRWFKDTAEGYVDKLSLYQSPRTLLLKLRSLSSETSATSSLFTFVVGGDDETEKAELVRYLTTTLRIPAPTVLADLPDRGLAILRRGIDDRNDRRLVFVLLPPLLSPNRQSVFFETGCLYAGCTQGRGKTFLLHRGDSALITGLPELIAINISAGLLAADTIIRREVAQYLPLLRRS